MIERELYDELSDRLDTLDVKMAVMMATLSIMIENHSGYYVSVYDKMFRVYKHNDMMHFEETNDVDHDYHGVQFFKYKK